VGAPPALLERTPEQRRAYLDHTLNAQTMAINDLLDTSERSLGYAYAVQSPDARYVIYGEASLPRDRRANVASDSAFADLDYALYLGGEEDVERLLASSVDGGDLPGETASETVVLGDSELLIAMSAQKELGGPLIARLPWILAVSGVLITLAAAALVERLSRRRDEAETLALENAELYADQRSVAQTLQHSLLPGAFAPVAGLEVDARYIAGVRGIEVGGDWYDVIDLGNGSVVAVVGDVSGRGLPAATMMASLRYAMRAYAIEGDSPAAILAKLSDLVQIGRDGHFATVLCASLDVPARRVTIANAGHLQPFVVTDARATTLATTVGVPVGVAPRPVYDESTTDLPPGATLLMYTDGLVERRGEGIDDGVRRVEGAAGGPHPSVDGLLDDIVRVAIPDGAEDDVAILGIRWLI
jgi:serine phosphatase RsbU (regulator of sigma subunit)